uniref:Uncharacterized protein n=1 Tax=Amphimedon queenslandica TaxID=400682 RepID=A0A1X7V8C0_AMPQE
MLSLFVVLFVAFNLVSGERNTNITEVQRCANIAIGNGCSMSSITALINNTLHGSIACGSRKEAIYAANECGSSSNGQYCGKADLYQSDLNALQDDCRSVLQGSYCSSSSNCSVKLRSLRSSLGCCINAVLNRSDIENNHYLGLFTHDLWNRCGVQTVPGTCSAGNTLLYTFTSQRSCNHTELQNTLLEDYCITTRQTQIQNALRGMSSCDPYIDYYNSVCSVDSSNRYCLSINNLTYIQEAYVDPIIRSCFAGNALNCSSSCVNYLTVFKNDYGCCMNALFNSTFAEVHDVYHSTPVRIGFVYPTCGIEPPPLGCNLRIIAPADGNNGGNNGNNGNTTSGIGSVTQNGGGISFLIAAAVILLLLGAIFT